MTESSLTRLTDFLADALWVKFSNQRGYFGRVSKEVDVFFNLYMVWCYLDDKKVCGKEIDEDFFATLWKKLKSDGKKLSDELSIEELHLKLTSPFVVPDTMNVELSLTYRVDLAPGAFEFYCCLDENGILAKKLRLISSGSHIEDVVDYYFQHTPSAVI